MQGVTRALPVVGLLALAMAASGIGGGIADPHGEVLLGARSAAGKKAHALVVAETGVFQTVAVRVTASPNQRVTASWVRMCRGAGFFVRESGGAARRTPFLMQVPEHDPVAECRIAGDAVLAKRGRVTIQVVGS